MSDYIAFFANPQSLLELRNYNWDSPEDVDALFERLNEDEELTRVWGDTRDGWVLSGLSDWITKRLKLPALGSAQGAEFVLDCEYLHWIMDYATQINLREKMDTIDPRDDEMFGPTISEYFEALGLEYVETYVDRGLDEYYKMYDDIKLDLGSSADDTLFVLNPLLTGVFVLSNSMRIAAV